MCFAVITFLVIFRTLPRWYRSVFGTSPRSHQRIQFTQNIRIIAEWINSHFRTRSTPSDIRFLLFTYVPCVPTDDTATVNIRELAIFWELINDVLSASLEWEITDYLTISKLMHVIVFPFHNWWFISILVSWMSEWRNAWCYDERMKERVCRSLPLTSARLLSESTE